MKTLDEVIKAFEICIGYYCSNAEHDVCPYLGESDMGCMKEPEKDALHYLKDYKRYQNTPSRIGHMALVDWFEESQKNEPLTWDELKVMEGKPVWIEWTGSPRWGIVDGIYKDAFGAENLVVCVPHDYLHFDKRMQGDVWQAYRKERKCE